jgi:hypothetical protein
MKRACTTSTSIEIVSFPIIMGKLACTTSTSIEIVSFPIIMGKLV